MAYDLVGDLTENPISCVCVSLPPHDEAVTPVSPRPRENPVGRLVRDHEIGLELELLCGRVLTCGLEETLPVLSEAQPLVDR